VRRAVLALACVALAASVGTGCVMSQAAPLEPVTVILVGRVLPPEFGTAFVRGSVMRVAGSGVEIGVIESVDASSSPVTFTLPDGTAVERPSPLYRDYRVTLAGSARPDGEGWLFPGGRLSVGQEGLMGTKRISFTGLVLSIEPEGK
jgi:hypothetical protein